MLSRAILVKDLIESQRNTIQMSSQSDFMGGTASVGDLWYMFVKRPWTTSSNGFVVNTL